MCMDHSIICKCGKREASFNFKNEIMPPEVVEVLYCPDCSKDLVIEKEMMVHDNGWVIKYDMEVAGLYRNRLPVQDGKNLSPETLFDQGYVTWRGIYPGDHIDSLKEKRDLAELAKVDPKRYFSEMKTWAINRMIRLKEEGWRKAYEG
jgi:hypothetical protein